MAFFIIAVPVIGPPVAGLISLAATFNTNHQRADVVITDPIVEKAVRRAAKKPTGELTNADLEKVTRLVSVDTKITDAGLKELAKCKKLKSLIVDSTQITDAGLKDITKMQGLETLGLGHAKITDAGLKEVAKCKKLG